MKTERETFEDNVFQPPFTARMQHEAGRYTSRMGAQDREAFMRIALERFYDLRNKLLTGDDVRRYWVEALNQAAASRRFWWIWFTWHEGGWVKGAQWRGRD